MVVAMRSIVSGGILLTFRAFWACFAFERFGISKDRNGASDTRLKRP